MTQHERLDTALEKNNGILRTSEVVEMGISKPVFYDYVKSKDLKQAAHGIYVSDENWTDTLYLLHLRYSQLVFSHETALFFHDLTDREPFSYSATVKRGYNISSLKGEGISVYTVKKEMHGIGVSFMKTPFGHSVPVYDMERTICDLIRNLSKKKSADAQVLMRNYMMERFSIILN